MGLRLAEGIDPAALEARFDRAARRSGSGGSPGWPWPAGARRRAHRHDRGRAPAARLRSSPKSPPEPSVFRRSRLSFLRQTMNQSKLLGAGDTTVPSPSPSPAALPAAARRCRRGRSGNCRRPRRSRPGRAGCAPGMAARIGQSVRRAHRQQHRVIAEAGEAIGRLAVARAIAADQLRRSALGRRRIQAPRSRGGLAQACGRWPIVRCRAGAADLERRRRRRRHLAAVGDQHGIASPRGLQAASPPTAAPPTVRLKVSIATDLPARAAYRPKHRLAARWP